MKIKGDQSRHVHCTQQTPNVSHNQRDGGTHIALGKVSEANAFCEVASIKQDNAHPHPPRNEYIFQLREKAGLRMPSTKCIMPFSEHPPRARNLTVFSQTLIILQGKYC